MNSKIRPTASAEQLSRVRLRLRQPALLHRVADPGAAEPYRASSNGNQREPPAVEAFGGQDLGSFMPDFAVREDARFTQFMERVDRDLPHKEQQKDRRHLEETADVDEVSEVHPRPGNRNRSDDAQRNTRYDLGIVDLEQHQNRFHSLFRDHDDSENKDTEPSPARRARGNT